MSDKQEYTLHLTHAPNGGWVIRKQIDPRYNDKLIAAYSNKEHMLTGLSDLVDDMGGKDE